MQPRNVSTKGSRDGGFAGSVCTLTSYGTGGKLSTLVILPTRFLNIGALADSSVANAQNVGHSIRYD